MSPPPQFLFVTCQVGAEPAVKSELARDWPAFRFAYSRPGFLTFKLPADFALADDFDLQSVFARAYGLTLGKATGESLDERAKQVLELAAGAKFDHLHVWQRDIAAVGHRSFEPGPNEAIAEAHEAVNRQLAAALPVESVASDTPHSELRTPNSLHTPHSLRSRTAPLRRGDRILDCVLVEPHEWWVGWHRVGTVESRWPGGIFTIETPDDMVSRAYIKICEALAWSRLPVKRGDTVVEIGSAPGGASQALLDRGLKVIGIDPAAMDERVLAHSKFTYIQKRGHEVRKRELRGVRWLAADVNLAPAYTLDTVEAIVTHPSVKIEGLLLTLKLLDWKLADDVPGYIARVKSWGYQRVAARQLSHNRQEICVAALRQTEPPRRRGAEKRGQELDRDQDR